MGLCGGRESAHYLRPYRSFRETDSVSWFMTNQEWTEILLRTYHNQRTWKFHELRCNDDEWLREEFSMRGDTGQQVVGRSVHVADGFVSYGDILAPSRWETCEGTWIRITPDALHGQEVRIAALQSGGLQCCLTGRWQSQQELHWARAGQAHRLAADTVADAATGTSASTSAVVSQSVAPSPLWRLNSDGHAELNVAEDATSEDWHPCDLRFHDGLARFTIICTPQSASKLVLTYERQWKEVVDRGRFRGVDLVFDHSINTVRPLWCGENVRNISLHMAAVDEKRRLLQLVYSVGLHAPAALTVPVPLAQLPDIQRRVARWQRHVQTLESRLDGRQARTAAPDFEVTALGMLTSFVVDVMLPAASSVMGLASAVVLQEPDWPAGEAGAGFEDSGLPDRLSGLRASDTAMHSM